MEPLSAALSSQERLSVGAPHPKLQAVWLVPLFHAATYFQVFFLSLHFERALKKVRRYERVSLQRLHAATTAAATTAAADPTGCNSLAALPCEHFIWQVIVVGFETATLKEC